MAWNGSSGATSPKSTPKKSPASPLRGALALLVVVALGALAYLLVSQPVSKPTQPAEKESSKAIAEVKPEIEERPAEPIVKERRHVTAEERRAGLAAIRTGDQQPKLDMETYVSPDPGFKDRWERFKQERAGLLFDHLSENEIDVILETQPGEMVLDTGFHPSFERDFLKSCTVPIIISKDDDADTVRRKQNMIEAKKLLKEAYDRGESITELLRQDRENLQKAYMMRENMIKVVREMEMEAKSAQEVDEYIKAANQVLDQYGTKHIVLPHNNLLLKIERQEGLVNE